MKIDGKAIADELLDKLSLKIKKLGVTPTLAVVLIGDNPASIAYIKQKQKAAEKIGAKVILSQNLKDVNKFNDDTSIHGIIIQRPLPNENIPEVMLTKDVDGFEKGSPFTVPVVLAVKTILKSTGIEYLNKRMVVIGRGETAGKPIAEYFKTSHVVHSQTPHPQEVLKTADIIITCVGKEKVITKDSIKPGVILIGVGIWRDSNGKLRGDYNEDEIKDIASYYTPTPGGVGPVNVACLMQNLVTAANSYNRRSGYINFASKLL